MNPSILDLIKENTVNDKVQPTEKAQIAVVLTTPQPGPIFRFNSVKKGEKEYDALVKAWNLGKVRGSAPLLHDVKGDMFISTIDVSQIACVSFVDMAKRMKFVPFSE